MKITKAQAIKVGNRLGVNWKEVDVNEFTKGMNVELEHRDVTKGNLLLTGKIALAHLREWSDYYTRLQKMERGKR